MKMIHPRFLSVRTHLLGCVFASLLAPPAGVLAQTTGFIQPDGGPYDYNTSANWVGIDINGVWDSTLALTANQTVTFDADTALSTGLTFGYDGNYNLTLRSDGTAPRTITLGGDIIVDTIGNRTVTFGSATEAQGLNVDLGGDRVFTVTTGRNLTFLNSITGGDFTVEGGGTVKLDRSGNSVTSDITVTASSTLNFVNSSGTGSLRAASVNLRGGNLLINGRNNTNTVDSITGTLTVSASTGAGGINVVTLSPGTGNAQLVATNLERAEKAVVLFQGPNLGTNPIASPTASSTNISFVESPAAYLIGGGGAAGTTNISILPWAVGGTGTTGAISTFVTYDDSNGIRALDTATEFASTISDGTVGDDNVMIAASTTVTVNSATTVNSLFLNSGSQLAGVGTLTVTSGAVYLNANADAVISANLDFGAAEGVIGYAKGKRSIISGVISGSGGVTFYQPSAPTQGSGGTGVTLSGANTYTGDTTLYGRLDINNADALPSGSRTGDLYNYGLLNVNTSMAINGLNGNGVITRTTGSGSATLSIGDNDADGNFSGVIDTSGNGGATLVIRKIGAGTQVLGGANGHTGGTQVDEGTLLINNTSGSGTGTGAVAIASGARFGGDGIATGHVTAAAADSVIIAGGVNSIGTLGMVGGLSAASGATFNFELNGAAVDTIDFGGGDLSLAGTVTFNFTSLGTVQTGTSYSLLAGSGDWSSVTATFVFEGPDGYVLDTDYGDGAGYVFDAGNHLLTVQFVSAAIPEPATCAMLGGLGALLVTLGCRRRVSAV